MSKVPYIAPKCGLDSFNCPYCNVYAHQGWSYGRGSHYDQPLLESQIAFEYGLDRQLIGLNFSFCQHCRKVAIWNGEKLFFPSNNPLPDIIEQLPGNAQKDYKEAGEIINQSPRAAMGLLRLVEQKLLIEMCKTFQVDAGSTNINNMIGSLSKVIPSSVKRALDLVRIFGNESVHPGKLIEDATSALVIDTAKKLKYVLDAIEFERRLDEEHDNLPSSLKDAIEKRDKRVIEKSM